MSKPHQAASEKADYTSWFVGRGNNEFPWYGGYSLGYALVKSWLESSGKTASSAAEVNAAEVLADWLDDGSGIK